MKCRRQGSRLLWVVGFAVSLAGCRAGRPPDGPPARAAQPVSPVQFGDITAASGIKFVHNTGAYGTGVLPEIMGSGAAFIDYDGDSYQDIFLVNGRNWTAAEIQAYQTGKGHSPAPATPAGYPQHRSTCALYHNNGNGTFTDVTHQAGLDIEMYGMGVAVGDYDNDGRPDLYVTGYGRNYLFHNETTAAGAKFRDVTGPAAVEDAGWSTSAAWVDYDRDGKLDLFVCHYVQWSPATDTHISPTGQMKAYVGPAPYPGDVCRLYHNLGHGRFEDASKRAGITRSITPETKAVRKLVGKALGVALCDYNNDGWPDLVVANDGLPNFLFRNNKNGTFSEVGVETSIAYSEAGKARAGMGVDAADVDDSSRETVAIGNFSLDMLGLYRNTDGFFTDIAPRTILGQASLKFLTFGCIFADYDGDGWLDLVTANGHVNPDIEKTDSGITYAERPLLFHNQGKGQFKEVGLTCGAALAKRLAGRGLAAADIDLDGDEDLLFTTNGGPPLLLRNDGGNSNEWVRLILEGTRSNRSAIGAVVEARVGSETLRRMVKSGSSYLSQSELPITLGLGRETQVASLTVHWPSGHVSTLRDLPARHALWINESQGIVRSQVMPPAAAPRHERASQVQ